MRILNASQMRRIEEQLITGDADPWDRFLAWAQVVPLTLRNPLYQWTHLELRRCFGIDLLLSEATAKEVWEEVQKKKIYRFGKKFVSFWDTPSEHVNIHSELLYRYFFEKMSHTL